MESNFFEDRLNSNLESVYDWLNLTNLSAIELECHKMRDSWTGDILFSKSKQQSAGIFFGHALLKDLSLKYGVPKDSPIFNNLMWSQ